MRLFVASVVTLIASTVWAATPEQWASRSIYQIVTDRFAMADGTSPVCITGERKYCGGSWAGIKQKLPYIKGMGLDAIWISPVVENIEQLTQYGEAYHGYWTRNIDALNSHFGTKQDLKDLVEAVHAEDMYIMVDVSVNSLVWPGPPSSVKFSAFPSPFNTAKAFHPYCAVNYTGDPRSITDCWLGDDSVTQADVDTESLTMQKIYQTWISGLISDYGFDGIRIDALKHVNVGFFQDFVKAAGTFALGENYQPNADMCCTSYQAFVPGLLNFPLHEGIFFAFARKGSKMPELVKILEELQDKCHVNLMGNFLENHDLARYAGVTSDQLQRINALAFLFVYDGIPVIYYGQEQAFSGQVDPYNREALWVSEYRKDNPYYTTIATLSALRKNAIAHDPSFVTTTKTTVLQHDTDYIAFQKGSILSILFNEGVWGSNETLLLPKTGYPGNTMLMEVFSRNTTSTDLDGSLKVRRRGGAPLIYIPSDQWPGASVPKPITRVDIDTRTKPTTTVTTSYFYPGASQASDDSRVIGGSTKLPILSLSTGLMVLGAMIIL